MWWRFVLALCILAAILISGVLVLRHIEAVCLEIQAGLELAVTAVVETGGDETQGLAKARALWDKSLSLFCTYVIHDQVDMVNETFRRAAGQREVGAEEYLSTLRELQFWVGVIQSYDKPTVRSIL